MSGDITGANNANAGNVHASTSEECNPDRAGVINDNTRTVIWPFCGDPYFANIMIQPGTDIVKNFAAGLLALRVNGCFAYESGGETHHSSFCETLAATQGMETKDWHSRHCKDGNGAD